VKRERERSRQTATKDLGAANSFVNSIIPWKSSGWKHLPDPICKSILGRDGAAAIACTQGWAAVGGDASLLGWAQPEALWHGRGLGAIHLLGRLPQMRSGCFVGKWRDALRRKGMCAGGGDQLWPPGAGNTLQWEAPLHPRLNVGVQGGCRGRQGPLTAPPGEYGPFLGNSKEPLTLRHGCRWRHATSTRLAAHERRVLHSLCPARAAPTSPVGNAPQQTHLCLQSVRE